MKRAVLVAALVLFVHGMAAADTFEKIARFDRGRNHFFPDSKKLSGTLQTAKGWYWVIKVTKDDWHEILVTVDDADDADTKNPARLLRVFFDGKSLLPAEFSKLKGLRRTDTRSNQFLTEFRVESNPLTTVNVAFDNYRRIQERMK